MWHTMHGSYNCNLEKWHVLFMTHSKKSKKIKKEENQTQIPSPLKNHW